MEFFDGELEGGHARRRAARRKQERQMRTPDEPRRLAPSLSGFLRGRLLFHRIVPLRHPNDASEREVISTHEQERPLSGNERGFTGNDLSYFSDLAPEGEHLELVPFVYFLEKVRFLQKSRPRDDASGASDGRPFALPLDRDAENRPIRRLGELFQGEGPGRGSGSLARQGEARRETGHHAPKFPPTFPHGEFVSTTRSYLHHPCFRGEPFFHKLL